MIEPLNYLSEAKLLELRMSVPSNLSRYRGDGFMDLVAENGWAIESTHVQVDHALLAHLNESIASSKHDVQASIIVHRALQGMTPAMAAEERVWVRLSHVECLAYSRTRWLNGTSSGKLAAAVNTHMFARGIQGIRDDNAVSRLWWNMHIATISDPEDPQGALSLILATADTRMQFVERIGTASRGPIARAVVRAMRTYGWLRSNEDAFRHFMIVLNREGGGVLFETLTDTEADAYMEHCVRLAIIRAKGAA